MNDSGLSTGIPSPKKTCCFINGQRIAPKFRCLIFKLFESTSRNDAKLPNVNPFRCEDDRLLKYFLKLEATVLFCISSFSLTSSSSSKLSTVYISLL